MSATRIQNAVPGETLIGVEPALLEEQPDIGWLHRLSLFTGRTLTATALQSEQAYRAGRLAILGQCVTQGVVKGLELAMNLNASSPTYLNIQVAPGYGISATGEDVALQRTLQTTLSQLQVIDPQSGSVIDTFPNYSKNASNTAYAGVLLLQPVTVQASGAQLDTGPAPFIVSGNLNASCDQDPDEYAFQDWQIVDGVRLVMVAWPFTPASLALPSTSPASTWRNRLAYTVFNAEMTLGRDARLPWDLLGVPVALIGFDNTWTPQFVDCSAVARTGGLLRTLYMSPAQPTNPIALSPIQPAVAQARVLQLTEQLGALPSLTNFLQAFALLPPCGVLPVSVIDFVNQVVLWFPPSWIPTVTPVYQEELESALLEGMTAQPLDVTQPESVEVLVPLPDKLYDPDILMKETVAPAFQDAVNSATQELEGDLQHRYAIQQEANALSQALNGTNPGPLYDVDAGLTSGEVALLGPVFSVGAHNITAVYSGDANNPGSTSATLVQTVVATAGNVVVSSSANPSVSGQAVTLTAHVSPGSATGSVQFSDGSTVLGTAPLTNGVASFTTSSLAAGNHSITAAYSGDANNAKSTSAMLVQTVASAAAAVTIGSSLNPSASGQVIFLTATVLPNSATGTIQFMDGTTALGPPVPLSGGVASLPYAPARSESFGTMISNGAYISCDYQKLITDAATTYTITKDGNGVTLSPPLFLFNSADMADMAQNGIQHFINRINAKLAQANDLLDLAFLTTQSDIYRMRNSLLGASDATALAVSPIVAQIATGESAAVTAANLQSYLSQSLTTNAPIQPATPTTPSPAPAPAAPATPSTGSAPVAVKTTFNMQAMLVRAPVQVGTVPPARIVRQSTTAGLGVAKTPTQAAPTSSGTLVSAATEKASPILTSRTFVQVQPGTVSQPATPNDVLGQSPIAGAQLNLRTLTIAQRMANPPSQDALFYATGNRLAITQLLADLEITIDDIPILVDQWPPPPATPPATTTTGATPPITVNPTFVDFRTNYAAVASAMQSPMITTLSGSDADEAVLFSTSIRVLEQHSQLLRAVEARIALYNDFLTECATAISNIQTDLPQAQTLITQLGNYVAQARQDVAFTTALLSDEETRVANVNAQRAYILQNYVQAVVYTRPRTQQPDSNVPSRQLVPGNIVSPVPACLKQSAAIPPELTEVISLLREAPVNWLPSVEALLNRLERPSLLQDLAVDAQARATMELALPLRISSAASEPGVYAPVISYLYSNNQQAFRTLQTQRAAFQPAQLVNLSWALQVRTLQTIAAAGDLLASEAVHMEVVNATSRLMQQISSVATCLYVRACQAQPIDRLAWAEFLSGVGLSIQMQSLAVLPNWNTTQDYVTRQQTQMLVDWLFQQIDTTIPNAVAFMSDVVRVAILLASDAPVNQVVGGAVTLATTPAVGGVISLSLPSDRIAHGNYVQLYSSGVLTAQAVVTDLDSASVRATVTDVYQPGVVLQANDVAHFTTQAPQAVALRAFDK